jgi:hypothetical protein
VVIASGNVQGSSCPTLIHTIDHHMLIRPDFHMILAHYYFH